MPRDIAQTREVRGRGLAILPVEVAPGHVALTGAHPDLADAGDAPYDAWADDDDPSPDAGEYCTGSSNAICDEHGTAVSGVILARANNKTNIVGMCPECTLIPIKMLGETGGASLSEDIAAFEHAIAEDAAIINNSWGYSSAISVPAPLADVITTAATETRDGLGALVVFAAGNDDREIEDDELQAMDEVLCVSATTSYGQPTNYTNYGASVDVAAPSATVSIAPEKGLTTTFGGTSAAAPVVSGLAGWALSVNPELSAKELAQLITQTAVPSPLVTPDDSGHHPIYGFGELNVVGVMEALTNESEQADTASQEQTADDIDESKSGCSCSMTANEAFPVPFGLLALMVFRRRQD